MTTETASEDDNFGTEESHKVIISVLGQERRDRVLAGLYMGRSDIALMVRQASLHVWKVVVSNTPKTLREILPTLFNLLLGSLASDSFDRRQVAARTLGDLVKKLGERVLPEIIPILEKGLDSEQPEKREGVCVGLSEIMASTSKDMVVKFSDSLVPTIRKALCDDLPGVRIAAARSFDSLSNLTQNRACDDIVPYMLDVLNDEDLGENALDGLKQMVSIKAKTVVPYLVPHLIAPPVNMKALASILPVGSSALNKVLGKVIPTMILEVARNFGTSNESETLSYAQDVLLAVSDEEDDLGLSFVMDELMSVCGQTENLSKRRAAITILHGFCKDTKMDYSGFVPQLIRCTILLFIVEDKETLQEAWNTLTAVTKSLDTNDQMSHVSDVRQAVRFALSDHRDTKGLNIDDDVTLPGFCLPKGIQPVLPIFRESILNGTPELKEQAAKGLGEVIKLSSVDALKPSVVHITGPLIRILGDRFASNVKIAVLDALGALLKKASVLLKPFFPQLQTTFIKALNDPSRNVRIKAGVALSFLIAIHMRPDPLFNELSNNIKAADDKELRETYFQALRWCLEAAGNKISAPIKRQLLPQLLGFFSHEEYQTRMCAAGCIGVYLKWLPDEDAEQIVNERILADNPSAGLELRESRTSAMYVCLKEAPERLEHYDEGFEKTTQILKSLLKSDKSSLIQNSLRSVAYLLDYQVREGKKLNPSLILSFSKAIGHTTTEVKRLLPVVTHFVAKKATSRASSREEGYLPREILSELVPVLVNTMKDKNTALTIKTWCESALIAILQLDKDSKDRREDLKIGVSFVGKHLDRSVAEGIEEVLARAVAKGSYIADNDKELMDETLLQN